jgi:hypothetical protein
MWFIAPYGSWAYAGFVTDNVVSYKKINIGTSNANYEISTWDFGLASNTPDDQFPYERHAGGPNGAIGCGCIRGTTPHLYLIGRSTSTVSLDTILRRFGVGTGFAESGTGCVPLDDTLGGGDPIEMNHITGIEVDPDAAFYIVTNNNDSNEFKLRRYAYPGTWNGADVDPSHEVDLSPNYITNNTLARIRGIAIAPDGNVIVFANTADTATTCKVLKFDKDDLSYLGRTTWEPNISTSIWGYLVQASKVYMLFEGLNDASSFAHKSAIYYDRATAIPDASRSNFVIQANLTTFGSDDPVTLEYHARDAFNIVVPSVNAKFAIHGEDTGDSSTWTDRVGSIQELTTDTFFDGDGVPTAVHAITLTDPVTGIATAYYKPKHTGSGTEIDDIDVYCPSDI